MSKAVTVSSGTISANDGTFTWTVQPGEVAQVGVIRTTDGTYTLSRTLDSTYVTVNFPNGDSGAMTASRQFEVGPGKWKITGSSISSGNAAITVWTYDE